MKSYSLYTDELLVKRLGGNDERAFQELYDRYWNKVYDQAYSYFQSEAAAKDIVQDLFLKLWENRHLMGNIQVFESYFFIMCRNKILSELRKEIVEEPLKENLLRIAYVSHLTADAGIFRQQTEQQIDTAIDLLPKQQRTIFRLSREDGLSHFEIAEQLKINRYTVKNHLVRALSALRQHLKSI